MAASTKPRPACRPPLELETGSPEVFGPLEKWSDADRSALRFEAGTPGKPKQFVHPAMDIT